MDVISNDGYDRLLNQIGSTLTQGRGRAIQAVNAHLLQSYWQIGRHIVEFEQQGQAKEEYGAGLISRLAKDLTLRLGKGFSRSNLKALRQFYLSYPKSQTLSGLLSWSHVEKTEWRMENGEWRMTKPHVPSFNSQFSILHSQLLRGFACK